MSSLKSKVIFNIGGVLLQPADIVMMICNCREQLVNRYCLRLECLYLLLA